MLTARITSAGKGLRAFSPVVEFLKDGVVIDTVTLENVYPFDSIYPWIRTRLAIYAAVDAFDDKAVVGNVDVTVPPDDVKAQAVAEKFRQLTEAARNLELKVIAQPAYDAVLADYKALLST